MVRPGTKPISCWPAQRPPTAFAIDVLMPDQSAVKRLQAAIGNQAKIRGDDSIAGDGMGIQIVTPVFPDGRAAQQAFEMMMDKIHAHGGEFNRSTGVIIATPASQDMAEGSLNELAPGGSEGNGPFDLRSCYHPNWPRFC
jgi:hypothetical protein